MTLLKCTRLVDNPNKYAQHNRVDARNEYQRTYHDTMNAKIRLLLSAELSLSDDNDIALGKNGRKSRSWSWLVVVKIK
jgi:hypothetical protein